MSTTSPTIEEQLYDIADRTLMMLSRVPDASKETLLPSMLRAALAEYGAAVCIDCGIKIADAVIERERRVAR